MSHGPLRLAEIEDTLVDGTVKGMPAWLPPTRLGDVVAMGWSILHCDVSFPAAVIREPVLRENSRWMREFLAATGASICPHGKTTMAPQLFDLQLCDGAWGLTAATANHVAVYRRYGAKRIILANQVVGVQALRYVGAELRNDPDFDFYCLIDSHANLAFLLDHLRREPVGRPLQLLLEIGMPGGRTGVRGIDEAVALARAVKAAEPLVSLRGVEGFEGLVDVTSAEGRGRVDRLLGDIEDAALACDHEGLFGAGEVLLTAGGSAHFDEVARRFSALHLVRGTRVVLRSGCYLTHDVGFYGPAHDYVRHRSQVTSSVRGRLEPALEVWAQVQSRPEPGLAIVAMGKRDVSHDIVMPTLRWVSRRGQGDVVDDATGVGEVFALNDQHAYVRLEAEARLDVGDLIGFGISHPCTTFDKWQALFLVDERYTVTGVVRTFF